MLRRALAINEQVYGAEHPEVGLTLNNLAMCLRGTDQLTEAARLMKRSATIYDTSARETGYKPRRASGVLRNLERITFDLDKKDEFVRALVITVLIWLVWNWIQKVME